MSPKEQAAVFFVAAIVVGFMAQQVAKKEAAILGLTALEVGLIGLAIPIAAKRLA